MSGDLRVAFRPVAGWEEVASTWRVLADADPSTPFFRSPGWVKTWTDHLPDRGGPVLFHVSEGAAPVGAALLYASRERNALLLPERVGHLQRTGRASHDSITVEYAGPVALPGREGEVFEALVEAFAAAEPGWDCLDLPGVCEPQAGALEARAAALGLRCVVEQDKPVYGVRLDAPGPGEDAYLAALGKNTRYQIRRSLRSLEEVGPLRATEAESLEEALARFSRLAELHQAHWRARGAPGAFADPLPRRFHRALIGDRFAAGEVSLLAVTAGSREVGYLYNFKYNGTVYNYQGGMAEMGDARIKPGLVAHYMAIEMARREGFRLYDFMAGEAGHKPRMGALTGRMRWLRLQRRGLAQEAEFLARKVKRRIGELLAKQGAGGAHG